MRIYITNFLQHFPVTRTSFEQINSLMALLLHACMEWGIVSIHKRTHGVLIIETYGRCILVLDLSPWPHPTPTNHQPFSFGDRLACYFPPKMWQSLLTGSTWCLSNLTDGNSSIIVCIKWEKRRPYLGVVLGRYYAFLLCGRCGSPSTDGTGHRMSSFADFVQPTENVGD